MELNDFFYIKIVIRWKFIIFDDDVENLLIFSEQWKIDLNDVL